MRQRAQASVETIALLAAALALAAALMLAVTHFGPPLAASIGRALSGAFGAGSPTAPALDPFERLLLDGATSAEPAGPTLLDLRTQLRSRLGRPAADTAFDATVRGLVARVLAANAIDTPPGRIELVDHATEDAWLRDRFHPGMVDRIARLTMSLAGVPGAVYSLAEDVGLVSAGADAIDPGHATGDLVVHTHGLRELILRRQPDGGLTVVADRVRIPARGGVR
jgi:hypothetical protein